MRVTPSPHIREKDDCYEVDLLDKSIMSIGNTLAWAFPDSSLTKGRRGQVRLQSNEGDTFGIVVDFESMIVYVSKVS